MKEVYLGITIVFIMYLGVELYFKCKELKSISKMSNEREYLIYKNNEGLKKELVYVLSRYCENKDNKLIAKNKIYLSDGELIGTNDGFCVYVMYDKNFGNRSGCITKYILDMKYWDLFDIEIDLLNESTVWKTFDLRER